MAQRTLRNGAAIPMESGERDRVVTIQQLTETLATSNFPTENWTTLKAGVYMRKIDNKQYERVKSDQIAAAFDTQWEMPYLASMDPDLVDVAKKRRLIYQDRVFLIVGASQIGRREGIELLTVASTKVPS